LKVKSYVSPLVIGLLMCTVAFAASAFSACLERGDLTVGLADHQHVRGGQRGVAGSDTVPTSE
jgi:hypothetical protein